MRAVPQIVNELVRALMGRYPRGAAVRGLQHGARAAAARPLPIAYLRVRGMRLERLRGDVCGLPQIVNELVRALMGRYPRAVLQFEDFNLEHALPLLDRYRDHHLVFNDDVQVSIYTLAVGPLCGGEHILRVFHGRCFSIFRACLETWGF